MAENNDIGIYICNFQKVILASHTKRGAIKSWIPEPSCSLYVPQLVRSSFPLPFQWRCVKTNKKSCINIFHSQPGKAFQSVDGDLPSIPDFLRLWTSAARFQWFLLLGDLSHRSRVLNGSTHSRHLLAECNKQDQLARLSLKSFGR